MYDLWMLSTQMIGSFEDSDMPASLPQFAIAAYR
jgi:hypothetical protein